jgi:hypothetical protein
VDGSEFHENDNVDVGAAAENDGAELVAGAIKELHENDDDDDGDAVEYEGEEDGNGMELHDEYDDDNEGVAAKLKGLIEVVDEDELDDDDDDVVGANENWFNKAAATAAANGELGWCDGAFGVIIYNITTTTTDVSRCVIYVVAFVSAKQE